jgi:integrase
MPDKSEVMKKLRMTVFKPHRRPGSYVARWQDPVTERWCQRRLGERTKREAWAAATELADKIDVGVSVDDTKWRQFCYKYEWEHLGRRHRSARTLESWLTTKRHIARFREPATLQAITSSWVSEWQAHLDHEGLALNSIACYSRTLKAALKWAWKRDLIMKVPHIPVEGEEVPRSRAVKPTEMKRLLQAVPEVRPKDTHYWARMLRGLSLCNLRISNLRQLSWDADAPIRIDTTEAHPLIRFQPRSHKSRKRRIQVVLPAFWAVCCETPEELRQGYVFPLPNGRGGQMSEKRIVRIVSAIGREAGILTNPDTGKQATSHDIGRRAFLPQIEGALTVPEAHKAMGHADFQTTLDYYDTRDALDIAAKLFGAK